jgi:hypothetical protein
MMRRAGDWAVRGTGGSDMKQRFVVLALGVLAALALVPTSIARADPGGQQDHPRGLAQACSHENVSEKNPNCPEDGDDESNDPNAPPAGGSGSSPQDGERQASCLSADGDSGVTTCAADDDADGVVNGFDNCRATYNPGQADHDGDGWGNRCEPAHRYDGDNDGAADDRDNCPSDANAGQRDADGDGAGDVCDGDDGADTGAANGVPDQVDPYYAELHAAAIGAVSSGGDAVEDAIGRLPQP